MPFSFPVVAPTRVPQTSRSTCRLPGAWCRRPHPLRSSRSRKRNENAQLILCHGPHPVSSCHQEGLGGLGSDCHYHQFHVMVTSSCPFLGLGFPT